MDPRQDKAELREAVAPEAAERDAERRPAARRKRKRQAARWPWLVAGMILGALMLAVVQSYTGLGLPPWVESGGSAPLALVPTRVAPAAQGESNPAAPAAAAAGDARKLAVRDANARGQANAPVVMIEYSDFQCPFCRRFYGDTQPQIEATYVATGKARFVYKHLAFLGQESVWAAQASECAADQGQFWPMHDELFRQAGVSGGENVGAFTKDKLLGYAQAVGLDMARFEPCLKNDATLSRVRADTDEARQLGFGGTPSFLVNNQRLVGAQPSAAFVQLLDGLLSGTTTEQR